MRGEGEELLGPNHSKLFNRWFLKEVRPVALARVMANSRSGPRQLSVGMVDWSASEENSAKSELMEFGSLHRPLAGQPGAESRHDPSRRVALEWQLSGNTEPDGK